MSVHEKVSKSGRTGYVVRWREGERNRSRAFTRRRDAERWDAEVQRRRQLGPIAIATLDAGAETLDDYVADTWAIAHMATLAPATQALYTYLYGNHIAPFLGDLPLREITADRIGKWQAARLRSEVGVESLRKAHALLGAILQSAVIGERIATNPQRIVRKPKAKPRAEVRPLAPAAVEVMRAHLLSAAPIVVPASRPGQRRRRSYEAPPRDRMTRQRDATLLAILAYAGLRPGEALALCWGHVQERTLVVTASKTGQRRSVRLLGPLVSDLAEWRLACGRPGDDALLFPGEGGKRWTRDAYLSWCRRTFAKAAQKAGRPDATPYTLRHSFASLLLHEGRSVIYVARQLGHDAKLTLGVYGHVIEELDDAPRIDAEAAIRAARGEHVPAEFSQLALAVDR